MIPWKLRYFPLFYVTFSLFALLSHVLRNFLTFFLFSSVVIVTFILVIFGTVIDIFGIQIKRRGVQSVPHLILLSFSVRRNLRKLTYQNYVPRNLVSSKEDFSAKFSTLHGIRVLIMIWLIITNTFIFGGIYKIFWIYRKFIFLKNFEFFPFFFSQTNSLKKGDISKLPVKLFVFYLLIFY